MGDLAPAAADYRLFLSNGAGRIDAVAVTLSAASDEDAIRQAEALCAGRAGELWLGARRVAMLNGTARKG